jgi:hypothetical protein
VAKYHATRRDGGERSKSHTIWLSPRGETPGTCRTGGCLGLTGGLLAHRIIVSRTTNRTAVVQPLNTFLVFAITSKIFCAVAVLGVNNPKQTSPVILKNFLCRIWGSYSGSYECCYLLGYSSVYSVCEPMFRKNVWPPSSGSKISRTKNQMFPKRFFTYGLHGTVFQKMAAFDLLFFKFTMFFINGTNFDLVRKFRAAELWETQG